MYSLEYYHTYSEEYVLMKVKSIYSFNTYKTPKRLFINILKCYLVKFYMTISGWIFF